jgi:hypothetical protein
LHLLGDLGLHLAEGGGLLLHLLETALHLVELVKLGGVVAAGPHVDVLAVDGDLLAVHLVLFVLHGRRVLSSNLLASA